MTLQAIQCNVIPSAGALAQGPGETVTQRLLHHWYEERLSRQGSAQQCWMLQGGHVGLKQTKMHIGFRKQDIGRVVRAVSGK